DLLNHGNLTVRTLATHELVDRVGAAAVESLQSLVGSAQSSANQRIHGLWALERLGGLNASLVETLAHDADRGVRVHLVKMLAERSWSDSPWVLAALSDSDPFVRRAAADALGRHPSANNINPLLALWAATAAEDTHLIHVARMALRDQLLKPGIYAQLVQLVGASPEDRERVANVSLGVPNQESAAYLLEHLQTHPTVAARDRYLHHAARYLPEERLPQIYRWAREQSNLDADQQAGIVRALKHSLDERGGSLPAEINDRATRLATGLLLGQAETQVRAGIDLAREFRTPAFDTLAEAAGPAAKFPSLRSAAIDACVACDMARSLQILSDILAKSTEPLNLRQQSAAALGRSGDEHARDQLVAQLQIAPEQLAVEIANALADSPAGGEALLAMIAGGRASPRLVQERAVAMRLRNAKLDKINERIDKLTAGLPPRDARTRALIDARRERINATHPDLAQGVAIFEKHCAICHRIGERGAKIGPNLDGVGIRGLDRLLEDVLDPNRNVDQAFRTTQIVSTDGRIISGLALREEGRVLVLADAQGKELRVPQEEIDQRAVSPLSLMPTNVTDLVSEAEFVNLLGYLLSQKQPK
ncbi:MAG TPA: HEAT repeat domain-containing protein, partial [Pirellulales bacterium]|nr:HEAT repeat domain-containing protein [Pirellulales bacterium]